MTKYLHICFEDGTEICVSPTEVEFYIEKYAADGIAMSGAAKCQGCHLSEVADLAEEMGILGFNISVVDARLARLEMAVCP
jgi:hypothetical protein